MEADRCVKCGLCLAVCPTYQILANEADSPRGRISLVQGLWSGALKADEILEGHLRGCLQCLRCQAACPSGVDYRLLIEAGLADMPRRNAWLLWLLSRVPTWPWFVGFFERWRRGPLFKAGIRVLPTAWRPLVSALPKTLSVPTGGSGEAALFLGCISRLADNQAQQALLRFATAMGLNIRIPEGQGCCGALHAHGGQPEQAAQFASRNTNAFADASHIISLASGCTDHLQRVHGERVVDACRWLAAQPWPEQLQLKPLSQRVALHRPCSQKAEVQEAIIELLGRIPGLEVIQLGAGFGCCGGAGMALLEQPLLGQQLVRPLLDEIRSLDVALVLTTNSGCALQLRQALARAGLAAEVLHPLELLERQVH